MECKHEIVIVYTTERISQEYDMVNAEWMGGVDHYELISVNKIVCDDCGEDVTDQFKDKIPH